MRKTKKGKWSQKRQEERDEVSQENKQLNSEIIKPCRESTNHLFFCAIASQNDVFICFGEKT